MKMILVPLDTSALAEQILPYVRSLARILPAKIHLLHVIADGERERMLASDYAVVYELGGPAMVERVREQRVWGLRRRRAEEYLGSQAALLREAGLEVEEEVCVGAPADSIVEVAEREHVALIAMATHGYSGLRRWALGSVADKVVRATPAPLLIVRDHERKLARTWAPRRIMVPLDGSPIARQALPLAIELAAGARAELILLQAIVPAIEAYPGVTLPAGIQLALRAQARRELDALAGEFRPYHISITTALVTGAAAEVIVDEAARRQADLIVMATHGYGGLQRWALGSVADKTLHATTTPLVLVRAQAPHNGA